MSFSDWGTASGDWGDSAQWTGGVPGPDSYAYFNTPGSYLITYGAIDGFSEVTGIYGSDAGATLDLSGGTLDTSGWVWAGTYLQNAGTLDVTGLNNNWEGPVSLSGGELNITNLNGYSSFFQQGVDQSGGTIDVTSGTLYLLGSLTTLNGVLSGEGGLAIGSPSAQVMVTLGTSVTLATASIQLTNGGDLILSSNGGARLPAAAPWLSAALITSAAWTSPASTAPCILPAKRSRIPARSASACPPPTSLTWMSTRWRIIIWTAPIKSPAIR
jgi:hypothetical protein